MSLEPNALLKLTKSADIYLNPSMTTIQENGKSRMIATAELPAGTLLFGQKPSSRLQPSTQIQFSGQVDPGIQLLHRVASEAHAPQCASAELLLTALQTPEQTRITSSYYLNEADLNALVSLHAALPNAIRLQKNRVDQICQYLQSIDSTLARETIENVALNAFRLGWFTSHFTPLTQLFRRCGLRGVRIVREGNDVIIRTPRSIAKGEEIFLSLGRQDIFDSVVAASEFDADLRYYIAFGLRLPQRIVTPFQLKVIELASQSFPIAISEKKDAYLLQDPGALLMESGPSSSLINFWNAVAIATPKELAQQTPDHKKLRNMLQESLTRLHAMNHLHQNAKFSVAPHLHKYVQAAQRDLEILNIFQNWITDAVAA